MTRRLRSKRPLIIVVDDIPDNRQMYAEYLEYVGYRVAQASNGAEALAVVRALRPDLVVMDLSMPDVDGWVATRLLKAHPDLTAIPILVVSGHAFGEAERSARAAGADDFLTKPCLPAQLADKIASMLAPRVRPRG